MRFVIVGCGYISRVHLTAMKRIAEAQPVAVVDSDRKKAEERAGEFNISKFYTDWNDAINNEEFDAALICLPHKLHFKCVMDFMKAGKHILLEKPISISSEEAYNMNKLAEEKKLTFMVAHMKRFDRRFSLMKEKIDSGSIGEVFLAKSEWIGAKEIFINNRWAADASQGGGPLMGFGSHHIDLLQWLAGPIADVCCYVNNKSCPDIQVEDSAVAVIKFTNNAIGSLIYTWGATIYGQYECITIDGTKGSLKLENDILIHTSEPDYGDRVPRRLDASMSEKKDIDEFGKEMAIASLEPFIIETRHFIDCVNNQRKPLIDGAEAKSSLDIIIKAYKTGGLR